MSAPQKIGPHGLVVPFEPKPQILSAEVIEVYQQLLVRETPAFLSHRPDYIAETKRRARLLIAMHEVALQQAKQGAS